MQYLLSAKISAFKEQYRDVGDRGLLWELVKMEIRAFTICFSKQKARKHRNYEMELTKTVQRLKCDLDSHDSEQTREEYNRMVKELDKLSMQKTRGACLRSKAKWYFFNLEKRKYTSLCINTLEKEDGSSTSDQDEILNEQARFYESLYTSQNPNVEDPNFKNECTEISSKGWPQSKNKPTFIFTL